MARRARRYEGEAKLNVKKIIAVIVFILVIIMFVVGIKILLNSNTNSTSGKIEASYYYTIYDNGKWGVINSKAETVIEPEYDEMIIIPDNTKDIFLCAYDVNYKEGTYKSKVINSKKAELIKDYENIEVLTNYDEKQNIWYQANVFKVQKQDKYGLCDFSGKELLACEYEDIETLKGIENSIIITKEGKQGLCDNSGNIIIEPKYKKIDKIENNYKNGYIVIDENNKYGIIGFDKSKILECIYEEVKGIYSASMFVVKKEGKTIVINKSGDTILENKFDDIIAINGENLIAKKGEKIGVIDIHGETKIKFEYEEIKKAGEGSYIAKKNDKYGIINEEGEEKVAFDAMDISYVPVGDFVIVDYLENNEVKSKIMDSNYETKITGIISEINEEKGYIRVHTDEEYKYYNFKFEEKQSTSILTTNTLFLSKQNGKYGFVDKSGKVVVDYIYDDATEQNSSGYAAIKSNGKWGAINSKGEIVANIEYNLDNNTKIDFIGTWHICEDKNANYYLDV